MTMTAAMMMGRMVVALMKMMMMVMVMMMLLVVVGDRISSFLSISVTAATAIVMKHC